MKKVLTKACAFLLAASMIVGSVFLSDTGVNVQAAEKTATIPESSSGALTKYKRISGINSNTITGADFTYYQQCLVWGKQYKNYRSQVVDNLFTYVKSQGINTISVKAAVNPTGRISIFLWIMQSKH